MKRPRYLPSYIIAGAVWGAMLGMPVAANAGFAFQDTLADLYQTDVYGFVEARNGWRLQNDPNQKDTSISEMRLQLNISSDQNWGIIKIKGDLVGDLVEEEVNPEFREGNFSFSPLSNMDVKFGRQVLTWGTGDLLFINDLFPKDWESFFIGRDDEYLKAPSDAVKISFFTQLINVDLVYNPLFTNSVYIDGSRISYWNSILGRTAGRDYIFYDDERLSYFRDSDYAMRLFRNIGSAEFAAYGYYGFWSTPEGLLPGNLLDPADDTLFYPRLAVYGMSLRGNVLGGIGNIELGYYDSLDDQAGDDPFVRNSEIRFLFGFEKELARNLTGGFQYYVEYMQNYGPYELSLPPGSNAKDEFRHVTTFRFTKMLMNQNLKISLFAYVSPSDKDGYIRPKAHYKISDQWAAEVGANLFYGDDDHTFFGQFEDATNGHAGLRCNF